MFTGVIRYQGTLAGRRGSKLTLRVPRAVARRLKPGGSMAVNGVCVTVESRIKNQELKITVMPATARVTTLGSLPFGSMVNLELPLRFGDPLDGHLVAGHVDGVGTVKTVRRHGNSRQVTVAVPHTLSRYLAPKGSIAVDGVSLTIQSSRRHTFTVGLIPETLRRTTLKTLRPGSSVNLEIDIIARYLHVLGKTKNVKRKMQNSKKKFKTF